MALDAWSISWRILAVLALVALNGFFVAAEFAIVKVRETQIEALVRKGDRRAKRAQHVLDHLDAYLSASQLGITIASLALGWIGEPAVAALLEPLLASVGITNTYVIHTTAFAVGFGLITFLHIVLGEQAPKNLAIQRAKRTALATVGPLHVFYVVFRPFILALNASANLVLRLVGIGPAKESERAHSEEELRLLLSESTGRGPKIRKDLILNAMDLRRRLVRQIMVPRPFVVALDERLPLDQNYRVARESGFTRFPLIDGDLDRVLGMVHFKDLAALVQEARDAPVGAIRRDIQMAPDSITAEELLTRFLSRHEHLAVVLDEFGATVGIVTLEDVLEELVGPIQDEFDAEAPALRRVADGQWIAEGTTPLPDLEPVLGAIPPNPDVTTVGGYVTSVLGHIPQAGERIMVNGHELVVRAVERRRVRTVEITRKWPAKKETT